MVSSYVSTLAFSADSWPGEQPHGVTSRRILLPARQECAPPLPSGLLENKSDLNSHLVVKPRPRILPRGHSLLPLDLSVDEPRLRKTTTCAVYVQLVSQGDEEFRIRLEDTHAAARSESGDDNDWKTCSYTHSGSTAYTFRCYSGN